MDLAVIISMILLGAVICFLAFTLHKVDKTTSERIERLERRVTELDQRQYESSQRFWALARYLDVLVEEAAYVPKFTARKKPEAP